MGNYFVNCFVHGFKIEHLLYQRIEEKRVKILFFELLKEYKKFKGICVKNILA